MQMRIMLQRGVHDSARTRKLQKDTWHQRLHERTCLRLRASARHVYDAHTYVSQELNVGAAIGSCRHSVISRAIELVSFSARAEL